MSEDDPVALVAEGDQRAASAREDARVVGSYYQSLVANGVPAPLAQRMLFMWHASWFCDMRPETVGEYECDYEEDEETDG